MRFAIVLLALMSLAQPCNAGGTIEFGRIDRLLKQKPEIRAVLVASLIMPVSAYAQVRLSPQFRHLGGYRLGQYTFEALSKSKTGGAILVTLCTSTLFLDQSGQVLPTGTDQEFGAVRVREVLNAVVLRTAGTSSAAACP